MTLEALCGRCGKGKLSEGQGREAALARALGLCIRCLQTPGVRGEWRKKLNLPTRTRRQATPKPKPAPGGILGLIDRARELVEETAALYTDVGDLTELIRAAFIDANGRLARLKERARALEALRASAEKKLELVEQHLKQRGRQFTDAKKAAERAVGGES